MFIDSNAKRVNIYAPYEYNGVRYANLTDPTVRAKVGVSEIPDPVPPVDYSEDTYYRTEQDTAPYVIYTPKSAEQVMTVMVQKYEAALDAYLDKTAQDHRYNDRFTFALRAGYAGPWQAEGIAFAQWMDGINAAAYLMLVGVQAGEVTPPPSIEEFIASLPPFVYPPVEPEPLPA
jgi:hypothetical protein